MNNQDVLNFLNFVCNKSQTGNTFSPTDYSLIATASQLKYFELKNDNPNEYRIGMPKSRQQDNLTQKIDNDLLPFNVITDGYNTNPPPLILDQYGCCPIPANYYKYRSFMYKYIQNTPTGTKVEYKPINVKTDAQWDVLMDSALSHPKASSPIVNFKNGYLRFYPITINNIVFSYLRTPNNVYYDYYITDFDSGQGYTYLLPNQVYTIQQGQEGSAGQQAGTSVTSQSIEMEFSDVNKIQICSIMLSSVGINLRDDEIQKYAEMFKAGGQP